MGKFRGGRPDNRGGSKFGRGRDFNGHSGRSGRGDRGGRSFEKRMYQAVCDNCGRDCEVPFKPTGEKPVYCNDCFAKMRDRGRDSRVETKVYEPKDQSNITKQLDLLSTKLDNIINLLSQQTVVAESKAKTTPKKIVKKTATKKVAKKKK